MLKDVATCMYITLKEAVKQSSVKIYHHALTQAVMCNLTHSKDLFEKARQEFAKNFAGIKVSISQKYGVEIKKKHGPSNMHIINLK